MDYYIPSHNRGRPRCDDAGPVPVNPSTVPGGRPGAAPTTTLKQTPVSIPSGKGRTPAHAPAAPPACDGQPATPFAEASPPPEESRALYAAPEPAPEREYESDVLSSAPPVRDGMIRSVPRPADPLGGGMPVYDGLLPAGMPGYPLSPLFAPGFLHGQIGRIVRVESLVGNTLTERIGRLRRVGADYLLLQSVEGHEVFCDLGAVRFVVVIPVRGGGGYIHPR